MTDRQLLSRLTAAVTRYDMIPENSQVAVGVSGGKDSLTLLYLLNGLRRFRPFSLTAVTLDPCFEGAPGDYGAVERLCRDWGIPYVLRRTRLWEIVFQERREKNPCSLCARMRRGELHRAAVEAGCRILALGHHQNDAAETLFMNLLNGATLGCFAPKTYLDRRDITLIRPMIFIDERDIAAFSKRKELPVVKSKCPIDGCSGRSKMKEMIADLSREYGDINEKAVAALQKAHISGW